MMMNVCEKKRFFLEHGILRKTNPPPFLLKTYMVIDDPASDAVVSWHDGGTSFVVWQPAEFARDLLPTLFKHSNFSSFVRQLNTYGFRKVATCRWEFSNDMFQRGKKELLCQIQRRKAWTNRHQPPRPTVPTTNCQTDSGSAPLDHDEDQRSSSTSSSSELNVLVDENKRLKMENGVLTSELRTMKRKCKELLNLVAIYTIQEGDNGDNDDDDDNDNRKCPMLFGVKLELQEEKERKRKKSAQIHETARLLLSQSCK